MDLDELLEKTRNSGSTRLLLRQSYREVGKPKTEALRNFYALSEHAISALRTALKRGPALDSGDRSATVRFAPIPGTAQACELDRIQFRRPRRFRSLALALIVGRLFRAGTAVPTGTDIGKSCPVSVGTESSGMAGGTRVYHTGANGCSS